MRKQDLFDARCLITIAETCLGLLIVSWKIGLLGIRVGEAAVPGPPTTTQTQPNGANHICLRGGGKAHLREAHSDVPLCMPQHIEKRSRERTHRHANVDQTCLSTEEGGRGSLKTAHSDVPFSIVRHAALEALSGDSDSALQAQSSDEKRNF